MASYDVVIIGAGAAGMMCAIEAGKRGRSVVLLEHSGRPGRKIIISGGGRCNFTNTGTVPQRFVSQNPRFMISALSRYTPADFIQLVRRHKIAFHEKHLGQLFCDGLADQIVNMLIRECDTAHVELFLDCRVESVTKTSTFHCVTSRDEFDSYSLVIATGGLSFQRIGAGDFGYRIARQFGLNIVDTAPALDGFVFAEPERTQFGSLAGVSLNAEIQCDKSSFRESLLFTHVGFSGPAALQASLYWHTGDVVSVNFLPKIRASAWLIDQKRRNPDARVKRLLVPLLPNRFADLFSNQYLADSGPIGSIADSKLEAFGRMLNRWEFIPKRTVGYNKAEVTRGGVDTNELSSKTMESKKVPGLYFIGEVVDVTGWLGGYNFQWAWASGWAAGQVV
ncbi:MAG TPA: NAD(P)/FAD-dependent oxidoreductase [Bdellovibrionota bacterium]|nr:NAD(P)/FAD-dependent oxidoreductase [Bdellovibrionota bacterium]